MPSYKYDIAVIGGGIVGTATAMQVARARARTVRRCKGFLPDGELKPVCRA